MTGNVSLRRAVVRASMGLRAFGYSMNASNVLITRHPRATTNYFVGLDIKNGNNEKNGEVYASNVTIDGGGIGTGIDVGSNSRQDVTSGTASAIVRGAIIRNVPRAIYRLGDTAPETASVDISYSSYDGTKVNSIGDGSLAQGPGNHTDNPDPRFIDAAHLDYRLRHDSPLIDAGRPTAFLGEENPDLAGHDRVRDSDGNGSAIRDIGAYEYQRLAPTAAFGVSPQQALLGEPTAFDASASVDPDGDPLELNWDFGDGGTASGPNAAHTFGSPGSFPVNLTVIDPTGLSAETTQPPRWRRGRSRVSRAASPASPAPSPACALTRSPERRRGTCSAARSRAS